MAERLSKAAKRLLMEMLHEAPITRRVSTLTVYALEQAGYIQREEAPVGIVGYRITEAGRAALAAQAEG